MTLAVPHLSAHHPQNVPLSRWTDGWLTMSVKGQTDVAYIMWFGCTYGCWLAGEVRLR